MLINITSNGNGEAVTITKPGLVFATGTWDGASLDLEISPNNDDWLPLTASSMTSDDFIDLPAGVYFLRAVTTGGGAGLNLKLNIR